MKDKIKFRYLLVMIVIGFMVNRSEATAGNLDKYQVNRVSKKVAVIKVEFPENASVELKNISGILKRQIEEKSNARVIFEGKADFVIYLSINNAINKDGFTIVSRSKHIVKITGNDTPGVLYGIGKFLHTSNFTKDGFIPSEWTGSSSPKLSVRAVYLATHFNNFYEAAPIKEVNKYIQDLGLWGYNTIFIHFPFWQFKSMSDVNARKWIDKFTVVLAEAKKCGFRVGLIQVPNEGWDPAPPEWKKTDVPGNFRGNNGHGLCVNRPGASEHLVEINALLLKEFKNIKMDYFEFWPYDEGGCASNDCWPWGSKGYIQIIKKLEPVVRAHSPNCKFIVSTWCFENEDDSNPDGEWVGLSAALSPDKSWADYIMADGHENYFPNYLLENKAPGGLPILNFPEISMFGMDPWGVYGTNAAPSHFQFLWDRIKHKVSGGAPYSEGIFDDINKAIIAGFYWDPNRKAEETVREYFNYEFSPLIADSMMAVSGIFEQNHKRDEIKVSAVRAYQLVEAASAKMTVQARNSWRWRIFYLRALIDKEMFLHKNKLEGEVIKKALDELKGIYYATDSHPDLNP